MNYIYKNLGSLKTKDEKNKTRLNETFSVRGSRLEILVFFSQIYLRCFTFTDYFTVTLKQETIAKFIATATQCVKSFVGACECVVDRLLPAHCCVSLESPESEPSQPNPAVRTCVQKHKHTHTRTHTHTGIYTTFAGI